MDEDGKIDKTETPNFYLYSKDKYLTLKKGCNCSSMAIDLNGFIDNDKITKIQIKALEKNKVTSFKAIVLHRTVSSNYKSPLRSFETGVGTHFLIAKNGTIYQTASLNFRTSHVGKIRSRCYEEDKTLCTNDEYNIIKSWENKGASKAAKPVHEIEKVKKYPSS